jgi:hypothetical protein
MLGAKFDRITKDLGQGPHSRRDALLRIAKASAVAAAVGYGENRAALADSNTYHVCCTYINTGEFLSRTCSTVEGSLVPSLGQVCPQSWQGVLVDTCSDCPAYPITECVCGECVCPEETPPA